MFTSLLADLSIDSNLLKFHISTWNILDEKGCTKNAEGGVSFISSGVDQKSKLTRLTLFCSSTNYGLPLMFHRFWDLEENFKRNRVKTIYSHALFLFGDLSKRFCIYLTLFWALMWTINIICMIFHSYSIHTMYISSTLYMQWMRNNNSRNLFTFTYAAE